MITETQLKLYEKQSEILKAVDHPVRLAVIDYLRGGEMCVCDIAEHVNSERSNVSKHLSLMVSAGVLESRKDGLKVFYKIKRNCILNFIDCINNCIIAEITQDAELIKLI